MKKYFDIYVRYGKKESDGYSIPVIAENKEDAKLKAINENLFYYEDDANDINYIKELTKEEYDRMINT